MAELTVEHDSRMYRISVSPLQHGARKVPDALMSKLQRLNDMEVYLPIPCHSCGSQRLLFWDNKVRCEECGVGVDGEIEA